MESHLPNLKYIRRIFESSQYSDDLQRLLELGMLLSEDEYAYVLARKSTYLASSKISVNYEKQTIILFYTMDESLDSLCEYHGINANSYVLSEAQRSVWLYITANYDFIKGVVERNVQVTQRDIGMDVRSETDMVQLTDRGLPVETTIVDVQKVGDFIAGDFEDYITGESMNISVDLITDFLRERGYLDFA